MIKTLKRDYFKFFFLIVFAFYCVILTQFGLENFDTGYIPSFSWRIINGQTVYEDFIYKGPPVTLYFHAFIMNFLPESGQFILIRIINYFLFALQVFLLVTAFDNFYNLSKYKLQKWGIVVFGFVVSLLNFSPYPWPTTDGVFFAVVTFWLLSVASKPSTSRLILVSLFCILSTLTKQSFYLIPVFFLFFVAAKFDRKAIITFTCLLFFWMSCFLLLLYTVSDLSEFVRQTTGETHLRDLISTGFLNYIFLPIRIVVAGSLILLTVVFFALKAKSWNIAFLLTLLKWLSIATFCLSIVLCFVNGIEMATRMLFVATVFGAAFAYGFQRDQLQRVAPVVVVLGIAWSSSISLGYQFPIFCTTGILLGFLVTVGEHLTSYSKYYVWIALPVFIFACSTNVRPYREANIQDLRYSLDSISPKLRYIKSSKSNFEKYTELKNLIDKYGENFIVAPSFPMANYLFNDQSELPADWLIETEVGRRQKMFIRLAAEKKNFVFLEKSFLQREEFMPERKELFSSIATFINQKFVLVDETNHFLIYNSIKKNEKLP